MSFSSSSGGGVPGFSLKKFESQNEVDEKKKKRQEEWEKVRKPDDPEECPEAPVDNRSLFDRLEEQRLKKEEEIEEKTAFRNQVRRLDADETDFLDFCTERQQEINKERKVEEQTIISAMQEAKVIKVQEAVNKQSETKARSAQLQQGKRSQMALLAGAVKRKGSDDTSPNKKARTHSTGAKSESNADEDCKTGSELSNSASDKRKPSVSSSQTAKVIGVLPCALPGITDYDDSSDSISSSSDSEVDFSLSGRNAVVTVVRQQAQEQH